MLDSMVRRLAPFAAAGMLACLALPEVVAAVDEVLGARRLLIKRSKTGREKMVYLSKGWTFPVPDGLAHPVTGTPGGISVELFSITEPDGAVLSVPAGGVGNPGWIVNETERVKYLDRDAPDGATPTRLAEINRAQDKVKLVILSTGLDLAAPQGEVGVRLSMGTDRYCTLFRAEHVRVDEPGKFVAGKVFRSIDDPPDCSDASLNGSVTTTTLP